MVLSLGPHHSFPLDSVPRYLQSESVEETRMPTMRSPLFSITRFGPRLNVVKPCPWSALMIESSSPWVAHTTACFGFRPVANAAAEVCQVSNAALDTMIVDVARETGV